MGQIEYFEIPEMPGKLMFRCEKRRASLTVSSCAGLWSGAHLKDAHERLWQCRGCPIGAAHAGVGDATLSPLYAVSICARCHRGSARLVRGNYCPSCINRFYEKVKGRNARGNAPKGVPDLLPRRISYRAGKVVKQVRFEYSLDTTELVVATLRDSEKQVSFGFHPQLPSVIKQMRLF